MKIKQQKQIKKFFNVEFGKNKGKELFNEQEIILNKLIKNIQNKSENQKKTLIQTILPRIAVYKAMLKDGLSDEETYQHMHTACVENDCAKLCHLFCDVDNVTYGELEK